MDDGAYCARHSAIFQVYNRIKQPSEEEEDDQQELQIITADEVRRLVPVEILIAAITAAAWNADERRAVDFILLPDSDPTGLCPLIQLLMELYFITPRPAPFVRPQGIGAWDSGRVEAIFVDTMAALKINIIPDGKPLVHPDHFSSRAIVEQIKARVN